MQPVVLLGSFEEALRREVWGMSSGFELAGTSSLLQG